VVVVVVREGDVPRPRLFSLQGFPTIPAVLTLASSSHDREVDIARYTTTRRRRVAVDAIGSVNPLLSRIRFLLLSASHLFSTSPISSFLSSSHLAPLPHVLPAVRSRQSAKENHSPSVPSRCPAMASIPSAGK
jgi:hypothetical protein